MPGEETLGGQESRKGQPRQGAAAWVRRQGGVRGSCPGMGTLRGWERYRVPCTLPPLQENGAVQALQSHQAAVPNPAVPCGLLPQLVPRFCEYWCEQVLREGASSLDSGTISLQLSDSFSLFELIEQYNMQMD